jgi:hypothetical protein
MKSFEIGGPRAANERPDGVRVEKILAREVVD